MVSKYQLQDKFVYLFVGRISEEKRISNIITAYKKVANANNRLLIVGDGPELSKLRKLTLELELKENIEDGIEYDPEKDNKYLAEDEVVAEDDLKDGYVEAEEDDILLDDENDSENDELFENLDDEDDEAIFDSDMSEDNLDD